MSERPTNQLGAVSEAALAQARGRLADRGVDPDHRLGKGELDQDVDVAALYTTLGAIAATEKAGQAPTHAAAHLALHAGLPNEIADTLFLAYNQQSAEEAGHGDKVFGNAYYALGGAAPGSELSVVGTSGDAATLLAPGDDSKQNKKRLGSFAAVLGGIETVALQRAFPSLLGLCERWDHPVARDLVQQIHDVVRPEESRHVLLFRYVFHQLIASKSEEVIAAFHAATNAGRAQLGAAALDRAAFEQLVGTSSPTARQLLGKDRPLAAHGRAPTGSG
jgi:hypothetical protein